MNIGNRIKELRNYKILGFAEFAAIGGVSERSQRMYEGNKTPPTSEYCTAIAEKFKDIDMNWLLTGEGEMLKGERAANDAVSITPEEAQYLRWLRNMLPEQKKDTLALAEKFGRWNQQVIERQGRHHATMA